MDENEEIRINKGKEKLIAVVVLISILGIQFNCLLREYFKIGFSLTAFIYLFSLMMLFPFIKKLTLIKNKYLGLIIFYNCYVLFNWFINDRTNSGGFPISYTVYVLIFCLVIMAADIGTISNVQLLTQIIWWTIGVLNVLLLLIVVIQKGTVASIHIMNYGSDRVSLSQIPLLFLVMDHEHNVRNGEKKYRLLFLLISIVNVLICTKKAIFIVLILIFILNEVRNKSIKKKHIKQALIAFLFIAGGVGALYYGNTKISDQFRTFMTTFISGILGILGKAQGEYNTGSIRYSNINELLYEYRNFYSLREYIFGRGYNYGWVDFAYFQAFVDLGVIGGITYLIVQFVIPIKLFMKKSENQLVRMLQNAMMVAAMTNIYSGTPYGHTKFLPIIVLIFVLVCTNGANNQIEKKTILGGSGKC